MLDIAAGVVRPGVSTEEVDRVVHEVRFPPHFLDDSPPIAAGLCGKRLLSFSSQLLQLPQVLLHVSCLH